MFLTGILRLGPPVGASSISLPLTLFEIRGELMKNGRSFRQ